MLVREKYPFFGVRRECEQSNWWRSSLPLDKNTNCGIPVRASCSRAIEDSSLPLDKYTNCGIPVRASCSRAIEDSSLPLDKKTNCGIPVRASSSRAIDCT
ncbi:hypothetical protein ACFE04_026437 [Oxalis oulophora]